MLTEPLKIHNRESWQTEERDAMLTDLFDEWFEFLVATQRENRAFVGRNERRQGEILDDGEINAQL